MKLMHIFFRVLAQQHEKEASELDELDVLNYYNHHKDPDGKLPVQITFGFDHALKSAPFEVVHADWDRDHLITGFRVWRTLNNFDR